MKNEAETQEGRTFEGAAFSKTLLKTSYSALSSDTAQPIVAGATTQAGAAVGPVQFHGDGPYSRMAGDVKGVRSLPRDGRLVASNSVSPPFAVCSQPPIRYSAKVRRCCRSNALVASIQFRKMCAIPALPGFSLVRKAVANDGSLLFLFAEKSARRSLFETYQQGIGVFQRTQADVPARLRLLRMTSEMSQLIELPELDLTFPLVDAFPDGRILVAGPRCEWRGEDDYDLNGAVIQPDVGQTTRILLGDGISATQIDSLGRIWVTYIDEGVFGNFGWGGRSAPAPVGSAGLACFSASGEKIWEFPKNAIYPISDCYALNVSGADAAIFFYTDFPICKISGDYELAYWKTKLAGCHTFAVSAAEVLFSGQYNDPPDAAYLGRLASGELANTRRIRLLMPDGSSRSGGELLGRGKDLYHFDSENAYRLSLD